MWEKKTGISGTANPSDVHDVNNTYTWSAASPFTDPSGTLYTNFLFHLNDLLTPNDGTATPCFAGYCDWRIPTIGELRSILPAPSPTCASSPCIDPAFWPTQASLYWSSSSLTSPNTAWDVNFGNGDVNFGFKDDGLYARAVRGGR